MRRWKALPPAPEIGVTEEKRNAGGHDLTRRATALRAHATKNHSDRQTSGLNNARSASATIAEADLRPLQATGGRTFQSRYRGKPQRLGAVAVDDNVIWLDSQSIYPRQYPGRETPLVMRVFFCRMGGIEVVLKIGQL